MRNIIEEKKRFEEVYGLTCQGNRFHYLFPDDSILPVLDEAGYLYDSSLRGKGSTTIYENIVHFPVHIMDSDVFSKGRKYQSNTSRVAVEETKDLISSLIDKDTDYISLLFHDRYFSTAHSAWRDWYIEIIKWIVDESITTTTYEAATFEIIENKK